MKSKLASAKMLSDVNAKDYDAIFFVGGHGPVFDLSDNLVNANLISEVCPSDVIVIRLSNFRLVLERRENCCRRMPWTSVCSFLMRNGKSLEVSIRALVTATDVSGKSIFSNKRATGFSNVEEELAGWTTVRFRRGEECKRPTHKFL